jgi:hypothetical protein
MCHSGESRARSEALALSSDFSVFWMPDQARHDETELFTELAIFEFVSHFEIRISNLNQHISNYQRLLKRSLSNYNSLFIVSSTSLSVTSHHCS